MVYPIPIHLGFMEALFLSLTLFLYTYPSLYFFLFLSSMLVDSDLDVRDRVKVALDHFACDSDKS